MEVTVKMTICYCTICPNVSPSQNSPKRQILDSSKLKEFADENFKFHENDVKFPNRVKSTVGKRAIAREKLLVTSNFSFSSSFFKRLVL